jgi:hypothetical protein
MAAETLKEQEQLLADWEEQLPPQVRISLGDVAPTVRSGERHGSWYLRLQWRDDGMLRVAELALTNAEATPDASSRAAIVSVRAGATTDDLFVVETLYEQRRGLARLLEDFMADQLAAAVRRAATYTRTSLALPYQTGSAELDNN